MNCPECKGEMYKQGLVWSGRKKVQRWKCPKCGRTTIKTNGEAELITPYSKQKQVGK